MRTTGRVAARSSSPSGRGGGAGAGSPPVQGGSGATANGHGRSPSSQRQVVAHPAARPVVHVLGADLGARDGRGRRSASGTAMPSECPLCGRSARRSTAGARRVALRTTAHPRDADEDARGDQSRAPDARHGPGPRPGRTRWATARWAAAPAPATAARGPARRLPTPPATISAARHEPGDRTGRARSTATSAGRRAASRVSAGRVAPPPRVRRHLLPLHQERIGFEHRPLVHDVPVVHERARPDRGPVPITMWSDLKAPSSSECACSTLPAFRTHVVADV